MSATTMEHSGASTHEEFLHHMQAMRTHYTARKTGTQPATTYALPVHLLHPLGGLHPAASGKAQVDAALQHGQAQTLSFVTRQQQAVNAATNKLQQDHDTASFTQQMEQQAQQQAHDQIHQSFQILIDTGVKHPEQQHRILSLTNQIGAFFTSLLARVANFFKSIAAKILGWINSAVDWIKGAAADVAKWASDAAGSVAHFFGSLF